MVWLGQLTQFSWVESFVNPNSILPKLQEYLKHNPPINPKINKGKKRDSFVLIILMQEQKDHKLMVWFSKMHRECFTKHT